MGASRRRIASAILQIVGWTCIAFVLAITVVELAFSCVDEGPTAVTSTLSPFNVMYYVKRVIILLPAYLMVVLGKRLRRR